MVAASGAPNASGVAAGMAEADSPEPSKVMQAATASKVVFIRISLSNV
jgi:hypothetical protein